MPGKETIGGYIQKKKDWIARARHYQTKEERIKRLRQKAKDKNPDEFHFHMINSKIRLDGVHEDLPESDEETETQKLLSDIRDLQYVTHKLSQEKKKIEKLQSILHFPQTLSSKSATSKRIIFVNSSDDAKTIKEQLSKSTNEQCSETSADAKKLYLELEKRLLRAKELKIVMDKLQVKKKLSLTSRNELKPKLVKKGSTKKAAAYEWIYERKK